MLLLFIIAKVPHLSYAFFWDESWVYGPAVKLMYAHGPSLLPTAIPVEFSKGHPLFFHAACATWMDVFGPSNFSVHCFALFIAILLAISLYEILNKLFNWRVALMAVILLLMNKSFFGSSSLVLNDIMLALLAFTSLYFYVIEKWVLAALLLMLLFFTKESGMIAGVVIGLDMTIALLSRRVKLKAALKNSLVLLAPTACILSFYIFQKIEFGWFLFPSHTSAINLGADNTLTNVVQSLEIIFYKEYVYCFYMVLLLLSVFAAWRQKQYKYLLLTPAAILFYLIIHVFSHRDAAFYVGFGLVLILVAWFFCSRFAFLNALQSRFLKILGGFALLHIYFCSVNFFEGRYLFSALFIISVVTLPVVYHYFTKRVSDKGFTLVLLLLILTGGANFAYEKGDELDIYDAMFVQQEVVDFMVAHNYYDKKICCYSFLDGVHLKDPKTGFLRSERSFSHVYEKPEGDTEIIIFDTVDGTVKEGEKEDTISKNPAYHLLHRFEKGIHRVSVFERQ